MDNEIFKEDNEIISTLDNLKAQEWTVKRPAISFTPPESIYDANTRSYIDGISTQTISSYDFTNKNSVLWWAFWVCAWTEIQNQLNWHQSQFISLSDKRFPEYDRIPSPSGKHQLHSLYYFTKCCSRNRLLHSKSRTGWWSHSGTSGSLRAVWHGRKVPEFTCGRRALKREIHSMGLTFLLLLLRGNTPNVIIGCIDNGTPLRAWSFWKGTLVNCFIASICAKMQSGISIQSA